MPVLNLVNYKAISLTGLTFGHLVRRLLLGAATLSAVGLMLAMAQVCRESVDRGDRWRAEQRELQNLRATAALAAGRSGRA